MRQPKFRGFSKGTNSWRYGFGWCDIDYTEDFLKESGITPQAMLYTDISPIECELASMGEFTGLTDKNGREIFEGDIYDNGWRKYKVEYNEERAGFFPFAKDDGCGCCSDEVVFEPENGEVIGNIFEDPELLEEVKA